MKSVSTIFCSMLIVLGINGQQHISPNMIEIPTKTIQYEMNNSERSVTVNSFYINRLPESIQQYKSYLNELDSLGKLDKNKHLPKAINLQLMGLDPEEIDFIRNEYFVKEEFNDYPIIGLEYLQIKPYLEWKANAVRKQILNKSKIDNPKSLTYLEFLRESDIDIPLQTDFLIPLEVQLISAFEEVEKSAQKNEITIRSEERPLNNKNNFLKKLDLKSIYDYDLNKAEKCGIQDELVYDSRSKDIITEDKMELKCISISRNNKYVSSTDSNQFIKPWRVMNIKI